MPMILMVLPQQINMNADHTIKTKKVQHKQLGPTQDPYLEMFSIGVYDQLPSFDHIQILQQSEDCRLESFPHDIEQPSQDRFLEYDNLSMDFLDQSFFSWNQLFSEKSTIRGIEPPKSDGFNSQHEDIKGEVGTKKVVEAPEIQSCEIKINLDNIFETTPLKKNQNIPKYVYGLLQKNLTRFKREKYFQGHEEFYLRFRESLKEERGSRHSLNTLSKVLVQNVKGQQERKLVRLVLRKTLNQKLRKAIIPTKQQKLKMQYLVGTKVYSLRCCNETLLGRGQFK